MPPYGEPPPFPDLNIDYGEPFIADPHKYTSEKLGRELENNVAQFGFIPIQNKAKENASEDEEYNESLMRLRKRELIYLINVAVFKRVQALQAMQAGYNTEELQLHANEAADEAYNKAVEVERGKHGSRWVDTPRMRNYTTRDGKRGRLKFKVNTRLEEELREKINDVIRGRANEILEGIPSQGNIDVDLPDLFSGTMKTRQRKRSNSSKSAARRKSPRRKKSPRGKKSPPRKKSLRGKKSPRGRKRKSRNRQR
tara:strand:+ start:1837 stop:2598 length:762 start_codon:yes stop_codon:yes gene_type:complete